ncbi:ATP-binding protein [bacterium]|nr:ATP-binding protein [bacterium]
MINRVTLKNFGPLVDIDWNDLGPINLVIGGNGAGKTFLLKALYTAMRTIELNKRGVEPRDERRILYDNLFWTFQTSRVGDLVTKGYTELVFSLLFGKKKFSYTFGRETLKQIQILDNNIPARSTNSVFLPAKEVLSFQHIVARIKEDYREYGFDSTYIDLAKALDIMPMRGRNFGEFAQARDDLKDLIGGRIWYDKDSKRWYFYNKKNQKFEIGVTAEGVKKISIFDILLGNRYLRRESIVFIDEPEAALHPEAISKFLEILSLLAEGGIQLFLASHSYFVIKKLLLVAKEKKMSIPVLSHSSDEGWTCGDLNKGMPANPIIKESIKLYKEEVWSGAK